MTPIETNDLTGSPVSIHDVTEAITAIKNVLLHPAVLLSLPLELAVQLPNALRCLNELEKLKRTTAQR
jgi:hypothetical protein